MRRSAALSAAIGLVTGCASQAAQKGFHEFSASLINRSGDRFVLSRHVGSDPEDPKRAVVLDFGASHCVPCILELPALQRLEKAYRERGVLFVMIALDDQPEGIAAMRAIAVDKLAIEFPVVSDADQSIADAFRIEVLPTIVVLDGGGRVAWRDAGFKGSTIEDLQSHLDTLSRK